MEFTCHCPSAVTELVEGDSSRRIVELICRTRWLQSENNCVTIERVLKVHNMQMTLVQFEEHRETVKIKASKLPSKHSRCLADGNELLRFYGTIVACSLGKNGSSSLCRMEKCGACQILRHGFTDKEANGKNVGIFTTSTSGRALECIEVNQDNRSVTKALLLCRVIAGRVHRPLENFQEMAGQSGFDSLAGKVGQNSHVLEELYLLNPKALLPCFVVQYALNMVYSWSPVLAKHRSSLFFSLVTFHTLTCKADTKMNPAVWAWVGNVLKWA
ncbi:unnamed protein product [Dovyalis caffra]|uniref:Uncharacterized protein n=1 Tax=Dovyalis caffra TaxID=77055 RepID=A0AAV1SK59_9ROSI|nr:unnamed protein product [Dovyalis caffra]